MRKSRIYYDRRIYKLEMFMMWKAPRGHQDDQGYHEDFDEVD